MKKSKLLLVIMLAVVLCIACVCGSTFSWYTRPNEQSGSSLKWDSNYSISNGEGIAMQTLASADGGKTYTEEVSSFSNTAGLAPGKCVYYRTAIMNSSTASPQSVSLFLSQLDLSDNSGGKFYLGVNGPLKTYKNYAVQTVSSNEPIQSKVHRQNVYVGLESVEESENKFTDRNLSVHSWNYDSDCSWSNAKNTGNTRSWSLGSNYWENASRTFNIYAFEIDSRSTKFQIVDTDGRRTDAMPTISSNNTIVYFEDGGAYHSQQKNSAAAAKIEKFYSSAKVKVDDTVSIPATGTNITYSSSNTSVAKVSADGTVTGVRSGTAKITATSTGVYGDTITAECLVRVNHSGSFADVPVVTNFKISAAPDSTNAAVEYVYWYIKNDSSSVLKYSIADIYLSL